MLAFGVSTATSLNHPPNATIIVKTYLALHRMTKQLVGNRSKTLVVATLLLPQAK